MSSGRRGIETVGPVFREKTPDHLDFEQQPGTISTECLVISALHRKSGIACEHYKTDSDRLATERKKISAANRAAQFSRKSAHREFSRRLTTCERCALP